jgi:hypothetical protein
MPWRARPARVLDGLVKVVGISRTGAETRGLGPWEQGDLNPHMRVSPRAPVIRHWDASRPSANSNLRGPEGRPDWSPLVYQISLCSLRDPREFLGRYPLFSSLGRVREGGAVRVFSRNPYVQYHLSKF